MGGAGRNQITQDLVAWVKGFGFQYRKVSKVLSKGEMA